MDLPRRTPWAVVGAVVLGVAISGGLAYVVSRIGAEPDDTGAAADAAPAPAPSSRAAAPPAPDASAPPPPPAARCWDGSAAADPGQCPPPTGVEGLAWVFPLLPAQRCTPPQREPGAVVRVLCRARTSEGAKVLLSYYQWRSVDAGRAFYEGQGLPQRSGAAAVEGLLAYANGPAGGATKTGLVYATEPYSVTIAMPRGTRLPGPFLAFRPADQVRGEPAA